MMKFINLSFFSVLTTSRFVEESRNLLKVQKMVEFFQKRSLVSGYEYDYEYMEFCSDDQSMYELKECFWDVKVPYGYNCEEYLEFFYEMLHCVEKSCDAKCEERQNLFDVEESYDPKFTYDCRGHFEEQTFGYDSCKFLDSRGLCRFGEIEEKAQCIEPINDLFEQHANNFLSESLPSKAKLLRNILLSRESKSSVQFENETTCEEIGELIDQSFACLENACDFKCSDKLYHLQEFGNFVSNYFNCNVAGSCPTESPTISKEYEVQDGNFTPPPTSSEEVTFPPVFNPPVPEEQSAEEDRETLRMVVLIILVLGMLILCFGVAFHKTTPDTVNQSVAAVPSV
eukprot:snap_masked-scaffold_1-processed-gene-14.19-mRNA-1 protein AED:1.00 eAED:1.00 QI:0/0/0/0/1/1/2/0/341